jgi:hypothetical protein
MKPRARLPVEPPVAPHQRQLQSTVAKEEPPGARVKAAEVAKRRRPGGRTRVAARRPSPLPHSLRLLRRLIVKRRRLCLRQPPLLLEYSGVIKPWRRPPHAQPPPPCALLYAACRRHRRLHRRVLRSRELQANLQRSVPFHRIKLSCSRSMEEMYLRKLIM